MKKTVAALLFTVLGACSASAPSGVFVSSGAQHIGGNIYIDEVAPNDYLLVLDGEVTPETSFSFQALAQINDINALVITQSPGGSLHAAHQIGDVIKRKGIKTAVFGVCYSACVDIFIAGRTRGIAENARLGLHSADDPEYGLALNRPYWARMGLSEVNERAYTVPHENLWLIEADEAMALRLATELLE